MPKGVRLSMVFDVIIYFSHYTIDKQCEIHKKLV